MIVQFMPIETTTTQDAPAEILFKLWPWLEANRNKIIGLVVALLVVVSIYYFMASQREENERAAGAALTQLMMTPPTGTDPAVALSQLATKYAGTAAGQRAQLQAAATEFSVAKYADAQAAFEKFVADNSTSTLVSMAQLGIAASLEAQNKPDAAATAYQKVVSMYATSPSYLPAMCGLGRIAEAQGKLKEALDHFGAVVRAGQSGGTLYQEAMMRAAELEPKVAALTPKPAAATAMPTTASQTITVPAAK